MKMSFWRETTFTLYKLPEQLVYCIESQSHHLLYELVCERLSNGQWVAPLIGSKYLSTGC